MLSATEPKGSQGNYDGFAETRKRFKHYQRKELVITSDSTTMEQEHDVFKDWNHIAKQPADQNFPSDFRKVAAWAQCQQSQEVSVCTLKTNSRLKGFMLKSKTNTVTDAKTTCHRNKIGPLRFFKRHRTNPHKLCFVFSAFLTQVCLFCFYTIELFQTLEAVSRFKFSNC